MGEEIAVADIESDDKEKEGKYLTFALGDEHYGIGILKVKEIIGMMPVTAIPQTPSFVKGIINLRGKVIPVIDLRLRFSMEPVDYTDRTCIIVIELNTEKGIVNLGIVVDFVNEVLNIDSRNIEDPPELGTGISTEYILGIAKTGDSVKILLDTDRIFNSDEILSFEKMSGAKKEG